MREDGQPRRDGQPARPRVLIAGGGVAALEAALALRDLAGDRLEVELCSPRGEFVYRPFAVGEPFGVASILRYDLDSLVERIGASFRLGGVYSVDPEAGLATTRDGEQVPYDYLLVASGARMLWAVPGSVTFWGVADEGGVGAVVRRLRAGALRDVVFTMPGGHSWALPVYELALLGSAMLGKSGIEDARLTVVTPEDAPLELFGRAVGEQMAQLLGEHRIEVVAGVHPVDFEDGRLRVAPGEPIETEAVVSLPRLEGRRIDGLPHDADGFLRVDEHCRRDRRGAGLRGRRRDVLPRQAGRDRDAGGRRRRRSDRRRGRLRGRAGAVRSGAARRALDRRRAALPLRPAERRPRRSLEAERASRSGRSAEGKIVGRYLSPFLAGLPDREERLIVSG